MASPLPEDRLVCSLFNRCAVAVGMNDKDAAFEIVRELYLLEGKCFLSIIPPASRRAENTSSGFVGRPILAKFFGRCAVCASGFGVGADILYDASQKRAAHLSCGEPG